MVLSGHFRERPVGATAGGTDQDGADQGRGREARELRRRRRQPGRGGKARQAVKVALTIPCAFARVEAMLYRETFADEVSHIRKSFAMLEVGNPDS